MDFSDGPTLPYVIPVPVTGRPPGGLSHAVSGHPLQIHSIHDLGAKAKWDGFYQTLQRIAELKLGASRAENGLLDGEDEEGEGGLHGAVYGDFPGADYVYEQPLNALGQADIPTPIGGPAGDLIVDGGNAFL